MRTDSDVDSPGSDESATSPTIESGDQGSSLSAGGSTAGPSAREEAALRRIRGLSTMLDDAIRVPGTNFKVGVDPIMGILPVGGDAVATIFALYPIAEAIRFGLPTATILKMVLLVAVDSVAGSIPVVGTVFDAFWKANKWNANTLERHLESA